MYKSTSWQLLFLKQVPQKMAFIIEEFFWPFKCLECKNTSKFYWNNGFPRPLRQHDIISRPSTHIISSNKTVLKGKEKLWFHYCSNSLRQMSSTWHWFHCQLAFNCIKMAKIASRRYSMQLKNASFKNTFTEHGVLRSQVLNKNSVIKRSKWSQFNQVVIKQGSELSCVILAGWLVWDWVVGRKAIYRG